MARRLLSDKAQLTALFDELADELAGPLPAHGAAVDVVMVGGAWMLWHSQRASTFDVGSGRRFEADLSPASHHARTTTSGVRPRDRGATPVRDHVAHATRHQGPAGRRRRRPGGLLVR